MKNFIVKYYSSSKYANRVVKYDTFTDEKIKETIINRFKINPDTKFYSKYIINGNEELLGKIDLEKKDSIDLEKKDSIDLEKKDSIDLEKKDSIDLENIDSIDLKNINFENGNNLSELIASQESVYYYDNKNGGKPKYIFKKVKKSQEKSRKVKKGQERSRKVKKGQERSRKVNK